MATATVPKTSKNGKQPQAPAEPIRIGLPASFFNPGGDLAASDQSRIFTRKSEQPKLAHAFNLHGKLYALVGVQTSDGPDTGMAVGHELLSAADWEGGFLTLKEALAGDQSLRGVVVSYGEGGMVLGEPVLFTPLLADGTASAPPAEPLATAADAATAAPPAEPGVSQETLPPVEKSEAEASAAAVIPVKEVQRLPAAAAPFRMIPVTKLLASPFNPRKHVSTAALGELAASIKRHGVLEPIVVRPRLGDDHYTIIAGERRWRAARLAGLAEVPCLLRETGDEAEVLELMLVENLMREDLTAIEQAEAFRKLKTGGRKVTEIAEAIGKSPAFVSNSVRLLDLPEPVLALVRSGKLAPNIARALLPWRENEKRCLDLASVAVEGKLTQRGLEDLAKDEAAKREAKEALRQQRAETEAKVSQIDAPPPKVEKAKEKPNLADKITGAVPAGKSPGLTVAVPAAVLQEGSPFMKTYICQKVSEAKGTPKLARPWEYQGARYVYAGGGYQDGSVDAYEVIPEGDYGLAPKTYALCSQINGPGAGFYEGLKVQIGKESCILTRPTKLVAALSAAEMAAPDVSHETPAPAPAAEPAGKGRASAAERRREETAQLATAVKQVLDEKPEGINAKAAALLTYQTLTCCGMEALSNFAQTQPGLNADDFNPIAPARDVEEVLSELAGKEPAANLELALRAVLFDDLTLMAREGMPARLARWFAGEEAVPTAS